MKSHASDALATDLVQASRGPVRCRVGVVTMLFALIGLALPSRADVFIFHDLSDQVTIEGPSNRIQGTCGSDPEACGQLTITQPSMNAFITAFSPNSFVYFSEPSDPTKVSDYTNIGAGTGQLHTSYNLFFQSDNESGNLGACPGGVCDFVEDGSAQTAYTITWSDGTTDTIQIESDALEASAVPEPRLILLTLILSMLLVGASIGLRRAAARGLIR